jgi:hypothetical protein
VATVTSLSALAGGLVLTIGPARRWVGDYLVTIAHEAGHAVVTLLCSGRVLGIRLHTRSYAGRTGIAGYTQTRTSQRARVPIGLAGYPTPAAIGLATLALVHAEHTRGALVTMVAALAVMLILIRNVFGAVLLLGVGAALTLAYLYGTPDVQAGVVGVLAWALLFGTTRDTLRAFRTGSGDAAGIGALTRTPTALWSTLFVLTTTAATAYACYLTVTTWT